MPLSDCFHHAAPTASTHGGLLLHASRPAAVDLVWGPFCRGGPTRVREADSDAIQKQYRRRLRVAWCSRLLPWTEAAMVGDRFISGRTVRQGEILGVPHGPAGSHAQVKPLSFDGRIRPRLVKPNASCRSIITRSSAAAERPRNASCH